MTDERIAALERAVAQCEKTVALIDVMLSRRPGSAFDKQDADTRAQALADAAILRALADELRRGGFQKGVDAWMDACFGASIKADMLERADRFTEEALELAQTVPGFGAERAHALVDYVFSRPVGERQQEVGGVMVTLAALCNAAQIDVDGAAARELARVWTKVDAIRAKQAAKPTGSALPIASTLPSPPKGTDDGE